jgi:hypothetical protein
MATWGKKLAILSDVSWCVNQAGTCLNTTVLLPTKLDFTEFTFANGVSKDKITEF